MTPALKDFLTEAANKFFPHIHERFDFLTSVRERDFSVEISIYLSIYLSTLKKWKNFAILFDQVFISIIA